MKTTTADPVPVMPQPATVSGERWIVFFGEDWAGHHSTGKYLASGLSERHQVIWVDSLGLRAPGLQIRDLRRIGRKLWLFLRSLGKKSKTDAAHERRPIVVSPLAIPWLKYAWVRSLNRWFVGGYLRRVARRNGVVRPLVITACPATVDVVDVLNPTHVIYYCADEHSALPGMDAPLVRRLEMELLERVDAVFAVSRELVSAKERLHSTVHYFPHGVAWASFRPAAVEKLCLPEEFADVPEPRVGYIGLVGEHLDFDLMYQLMFSMPEVSFVVIGPVEDGVTPPDLPNVHYIGARPFGMLATYLAHIDIGLLPWKRNERNRFANPTKVREYLAAGCPVVSTPHPELPERSPFVASADTALEFAVAIRHTLSNRPDRDAVSQSVSGEDWSVRVRELETLVAQV
ncbi:glycosyltransferase [Halofilum ochraceum]|uniref:glycosyltransferase n=1 Tax=Halofilum ochraceum TaxID=1611323 RepID=UPI0008D8F82F|nr:glycosyltransferase [Halofilum ochraceum]